MKPIEERIEDFRGTLIPFEEEYGAAMIVEFFEYWTEPNKSNTKFRQELEKTWNLNRRLKTWLANNLNWHKTPISKLQQNISHVQRNMR